MAIRPVADILYDLRTGQYVTEALWIDLFDTLKELPQFDTLSAGDLFYYNGTAVTRIPAPVDDTKIFGIPGGVPGWITAPSGGSYTLPVATDSVLGGVKVPTGGPISIDGAGNLGLSQWAAALLIITWLSYDSFDGYADGAHASLQGGISWAGSGTSSAFFGTVCTENFDSYTDGSHTSLTGGTNWAGAGEADLFALTACSDAFEGYTDGSHASLTGGTGWAGDATAHVF